MKDYKLLLPGVTFALGPILAYIFLPLITSNVSVAEYGIYTYYLSVLNIISFISLLPALNATVNRYGSKVSGSYSHDSYSIKTFYYLSFSIFALCVFSVIYLFSEIKHLHFAVIAVSVLSINIFNVIKSYLLINNDKLSYSFFVILINAFQYIYLFYAISNDGFDVQDILFGNVFLIFCLICFKYKSIVKFVANKPELVKRNTKILKFVAMSFVISFSTIIYNNTDKIMMDLILDDPRYLAVYQVSYQIFSFPIESVYALISIFTPAFLYRAFDKDKSQYLKNLRITFKVVLFVLFNLAQLLYINKDLLKSMLLDSKYIYDDFLPLLFLASQSLFVIYLITTNIFIVYNKRIYIIVSLVASSLLNIVLNYFLIELCGYVGAALSTLISYLVLVLFILALSYRVFNVNFFDRSDVLFMISIPIVYISVGQNHIAWLMVLSLISYVYFKKNIKSTYLSLLRGV